MPTRGDPDHYKVLEVDPDASFEDIKKAYRRLAKEFHPDKLQALSSAMRRLAEEKFKEVGEAYQVLSDRERRRDYDSRRGTSGRDLDKEQMKERIIDSVNRGELERAFIDAKELYRLYDDDSSCGDFYAEVAYRVGVDLAESHDSVAAKRHLEIALEAAIDKDLRRRIARDLAVLKGDPSSGDGSTAGMFEVGAVHKLIDQSRVFVGLRNYPPAIGLLKRALALDPANPHVQQLLADAKREWGQSLLRQNY